MWSGQALGAEEPGTWGGLQQRLQGQATHKAETHILVATHDLGPRGQPRLPHCVRPRADPFPPCARLLAAVSGLSARACGCGCLGCRRGPAAGAVWGKYEHPGVLLRAGLGLGALSDGTEALALGVSSKVYTVHEKTSGAVPTENSPGVPPVKHPPRGLSDGLVWRGPCAASPGSCRG